MIHETCAHCGRPAEVVFRPRADDPLGEEFYRIFLCVLCVEKTLLKLVESTGLTPDLVTQRTVVWPFELLDPDLRGRLYLPDGFFYQRW